MLSGLVNVLSDFLTTPLHVASHHWIVIVISFLVCQLSYKIGHSLCLKISGYKKLSSDDQIEWQTRITSTLHALVVFPICFYVSLTDMDLNKNPVFGKNELSQFCLCVGIGYFFSDLVTVVRYQIRPMAPIIAHHVFAGWGFLVCVSDFGAACWYATYLLLTEATAPFNNTHWKLTKLNLEHTPICKIIGYFFAGTWLIFRVLNNPYLVYKLYAHWDDVLAIPAYLQIILACNIIFLMSLNNYWFFFGPFYQMVFGSNAAQTQAQLQQHNPKKQKST